ncbi:MAG: alpha-mannosidase [Clostridia bacterium]|nr:alpha-mannosidase [Clostridia bacterium]
MTFIEEKIRLSCDNLRRLSQVARTPVGDVRFAPCDYRSARRPDPALAWEPYRGEEIRAPLDSHFWFVFSVEVPDRPGREFRLSVTTGHENGWVATNPQCTVFVDGDSAWQAMDANHTDTRLPAGRHEVYVCFYNGTNPPGDSHLSFAWCEIDLAVESLFYDLFVPYDAMKRLPEASDDRLLLRGVLDRACLLLDFRRGRDEAFLRSVSEATDFLRRELYQKLTGRDRRTLAVVGHTHIDVAWLWTLEQTKEKARRSFSTVMRLMDKYPEYIFMSSQPQLYAYVKDNDPALYAAIKEKVAEGRWEVEGALWLECDTNLVSGESLVRQMMYGKRFMRDEFGVDSRAVWLPDVFGYSPALPQIMAGCGVPYFFTSKLSWSETDKYPHDHFVWQGMDGTEVFAVLSNSYVRELTPAGMLDAWQHYADRETGETQIATFGYGDGGGGPTAGMLETYRRMKDGLPGYPRLTMQKALDTLTGIEKEFRDSTAARRFVPKWSGELYLEMHRGTYTSQADNKKYNRQSELLLCECEALAATAGVLCGRPAPDLSQTWLTVLKNQFHDILPGSSVREVYQTSRAEYGEVLSTLGEEIDRARAALAERIDTGAGGLLVFNPAPYAADGVVGTPDGPARVTGVPAHGWAVVTPDTEGDVRLGDHTIENDLVRAVFDDRWRLVSFFDKRADRECLAAPGNRLIVYEDYPRAYDAWEITEYYRQKSWEIDDLTAHAPTGGPVRGGYVIERRYGASTVRQTVTLTAGSPRLDFLTEIDWHEDHVLLKAEFPLAVRSQTWASDVQFGHVDRPTHRNTSWDQAKFEVPVHKWADLSDSAFGVSLLNDSKYGCSCAENVLSLSLLKAATYPDPTADRGRHTFAYALFPHAGPVGTATVREGYLFNLPLAAIPVAPHAGDLPARFALVDVEDDALVPETIKPAEDGRGCILRLFEPLDRRTVARLRFARPVRSVTLCDLLECDRTALPVIDDTVTLTAHNYEILTLRVLFA